MADSGIGRQAAAEIAAAQAAKGKAEKGERTKLGGPLGVVFSSVEYFSVTGSKEYAEKDDKTGKVTGTVSRVIGGMVGSLHQSGWKIGPFNIKLVTRDGRQSVEATFPAASGRAWAGGFLDLGQRTPEAGQLRDALKAQVVQGFLAWRREIMSRPVEQRPALVQAAAPKPVNVLSAEELAALGL